MDGPLCDYVGGLVVYVGGMDLQPWRRPLVVGLLWVVVALLYSYGAGVGLPWGYHGTIMKMPWDCHGAAQGLSGGYHATVMRLSLGSHMAAMRASQGNAMALSRGCYEAPLGFPWALVGPSWGSHGVLMGLLQFEGSHEATMGLPWGDHEINSREL